MLIGTYVRHSARGIGRTLMAVCSLVGLTFASIALMGSPAEAAPSTYVIGNIGTYTGPASGDYIEIVPLIKAWQSWTNAHGGINGHPVKVITADDQASPSLGLQDAQKLVQQDHAIAIVGSSSNGGTGYSTYLQGAKIPLIGATANPAAPDDLLFYPVGGGSLSVQAGSVASAKLVNAKKLAVIYCAEAAVCKQFVPVIQTQAKANNMTLTYSSAAPESAPSYTAYCVAAKQSGATAIVPALQGNTVVSLAQGCASQNYHPTWLASSPGDGPTFLKEPAMNGSIVAEGAFPYVLNNTPATKDFHSAITKYAPSILKSSGYNQSLAYVWSDFQMFAHAASTMKSNSASALVTSLNSVKNETLGGLIGPQSYSATKQLNSTCYAVMKQTNGKYVPINNGAFKCPPATS
jgi:branched-chain amino acid transport system substrate-binding protein